LDQRLDADAQPRGDRRQLRPDTVVIPDGHFMQLALLAEAGTDKTNILSVTIYLKDIDADFEAMNSVWDQWLPAGTAPARATVEAKL
ncbi:Rid family hydrolase, partial [Pseudoalteromonas sp. SIMBA_148]